MTRNSFGRHLRSEREQRGITLEAIAESTKIRRALLVALENGDLSKVPRGISGRAFLRGYAAAIGVPPEPLLTELSQLVCEPGAVRDRAATEHATGIIRLTLAPEGLKAAARRRAPVAVADTCAVLLIAGAIARLTGANQWVIIGAVGLIYFTLATLCLGRSFASWALTQVPFSREGAHPDWLRRRATFVPHWLADVLRSAASAGSDAEASTLDPPPKQTSAHSQAARP